MNSGGRIRDSPNGDPSTHLIIRRWSLGVCESDPPYEYVFLLHRSHSTSLQIHIMLPKVDNSEVLVSSMNLGLQSKETLHSKLSKRSKEERQGNKSLAVADKERRTRWASKIQTTRYEGMNKKEVGKSYKNQKQKRVFKKSIQKILRSKR